MTKFKAANQGFKFRKVLSDTSKSYVFRAKIRIYDNNFSGLLVIKPKKNSDRIVFLNEIGMKFFDIEIFKDSYKIHHLFEPMNKKLFIKLLVSDFNFILMNELNMNSKYLTEKDTKNFAVKNNKAKQVYIFDNNTLLSVSGFKYSVIRKNVFLNYNNYQNDVPTQINIMHKNIKFEMNLTFIK
jgi:hypothetical protein